ncbi:unnamed protein product [Acanthocheilonema viteae]|uniref:Uncharacterized protein n=1 Tax=Acanthocheilonema viteae TaxID=6277 RepID=A0A498SJC8_ACAVI|nr:unnamed protein product [Acanthocheilonema viteae]
MSSAHRKCPLSGLFGTPPSINFFSPSSADTNILLVASNAIIDDAATACEQFSPEVFSSQQLQQQSSTTIITEAQVMNDQLAPFIAGTLKTVDSDVLDCNSFQIGFMEDSDHHTVSPPFEILQYPIEVKESKDAIHRQLTNRRRHSGKPRRHSLQARMESAHYDGDSPLLQINALGMDENVNSRSRSPQHVEMYTFRDAVDVNYQRMAITGEELSGVPLEDLKESARELTEALMLRKEYMERIGNQFPLTTKNFLSGHYPKNLPRYRRKNIEIKSSHDVSKDAVPAASDKESHPEATQTSYNPPLPPEDHWGLNIPLPKYEKIYVLKRNHGMVEILNEDGKIPDQFRHAYVSKEKFLRDLEKLSVMIANGPLKSFCFRRLCYLHNKFQLHTLMNEIREQHEQKSVPHRDFYNIRKASFCVLLL